jgi:L-2-hydroxyglutarate oxidase
MTDHYDVAVVGAGIVGLATARSLARLAPDRSIVVLEKEPVVSAHQTGRNSGVIHAGLYYLPGSLKASLCVRGGPELFDFCRRAGVPTTRTGKVVVATDRSQISALNELERRARANGVEVERMDGAGIRRREPAASGIDGLAVPFTGAVDFSMVAREFAAELARSGAAIRNNSEVISSASPAESGTRTLITRSGDVRCRLVVNCAGLHADRVARLLGQPADVRILPFRGEYWRLSPSAAERIRGHIYPVPDPRFPHLGVHFTRSVGGAVEIGPNAVWAWGREAYERISGNVRDSFESLSYPGFWRLLGKHWRTAAAEQRRSLDKRAFLGRARRLVPDLGLDDLTEWRSGIRAQAVSADGELIHDFVIRRHPGLVNVINAPSPAATSCLTIGEHIARVALSAARLGFG